MFKGVLFDLDGVLTDTAEYHYLAWKKLGDEIGISIDRDFNENLKGVSRDDSLSLLLEKAGKKDAYNNQEFNELATRKNNYYKELIQSISPSNIYPGILALIKDLKHKGIKVSLASASKNGPSLLKQMNLYDYFDGIANPEDIKKGKPDPEIFCLAAEVVGLNASECIGIEDAKAGIEAIKSSGALPIGVGDKRILGDDITVVSSTEELTYDFLKLCWNQRR